jgi:hypothetical protein
MKQILTMFLFSICCMVFSQKTKNISVKIDSLMPVRGFCIGAPHPKELNEFIRFIDEELAAKGINTLILMVEFNFQYESHPELRDSDALSKRDVRKIVEACRGNNIRIIPQIDLLGHQSWDNRPGNLLRVHPEFDETPLIKMPDKYVWPNSDGLYCKSYCPLNPDVHKVVFALIDEICDAFDAEAFHAGMDEVFYIGESQCPRCSGRDKAELFADEVRAIRDHLAIKNRKLWIWGDRLLDGKTTGLGEWEASFNNTYKAIDLIPKDVMICDWHYDRPDPTPVYFAMKGFDVVTCPWKNTGNVKLQVQDMVRYRKLSTPEMREHFMGMVQTIWSGTGQFLDSFYGRKPENGENTQVNCFKAMNNEILQIASMK